MFFFKAFFCIRIKVTTISNDSNDIILWLIIIILGLKVTQTDFEMSTSVFKVQIIFGFSFENVSLSFWEQCVYTSHWLYKLPGWNNSLVICLLWVVYSAVDWFDCSLWFFSWCWELALNYKVEWTCADSLVVISTLFCFWPHLPLWDCTSSGWSDMNPATVSQGQQPEWKVW